MRFKDPNRRKRKTQARGIRKRWKQPNLRKILETKKISEQYKTLLQTAQATKEAYEQQQELRSHAKSYGLFLKPIIKKHGQTYKVIEDPN